MRYFLFFCIIQRVIKVQKYFISDEDFKLNKITSDDAFHISRVMRNKIGDLVLIGNNFKTFLVRFTHITDKAVDFEIVEEKQENHELPINVTIIQGYPKGDKFEYVIKHGVELGAHAFIPTLMQRSQFKIDAKRMDSKVIRFNKISKEASEQSFRAYVPLVKSFTDFKKIDFSSFKLVIICFEENAKNGELTNYKRALKSLKPGDNICVVVGPEGGISPEEIEYLSKMDNAVIAALGPRILRTETVVFYALSTISYEMELK